MNRSLGGNFIKLWLNSQGFNAILLLENKEFTFTLKLSGEDGVFKCKRVQRGKASR